MKRVLYNSSEIRKEIIRIFKSYNERRVAISAFIGEGADAYLPTPQGLQLICWPKAGSTNPDMLRELIKRGVDVFFADDLHMKLYWSESQGAVLTSANLSTNALGSGNQKEIGILVSSKDIDIDHLIASIQTRHASKNELQELDRLYKSYVVRNPHEFKYRHRAMSFAEWYESPFRKEWKLGWYGEYGPISSIAKERAMREYGVNEPKDWLNACEGEFKEGDWILSFKLIRLPRQLQWISVDDVVSVPKSDKAYEKEYPYQVVQTHPNNCYPQPPFRINNKKFMKAFSNAVQKFGVDKVKKVITPPNDLIKFILTNM